MQLIIEDGFIGGTTSSSESKYRETVFYALRRHAARALGETGYQRIERQWLDTPGSDGPYLSYAREHWDEIVALIVKDRLCSR